jgi:hypothetical protein
VKRWEVWRAYADGADSAPVEGGRCWTRRGAERFRSCCEVWVGAFVPNGFGRRYEVRRASNV